MPLPAAVVSLCTQKNNKERISLYSEDGFLLGLHQTVLLRFGIRKGSILTEGLFRELQEAETEKDLEDYFLMLLGRRAHSRYELRMKARRKGFPADQTEHLLRKFQDKGWINDLQFASAFARDKLRLSHWGPLRIRAALRSKGISESVIKSILQELDDLLDEYTMMEELVLKKKARFLREPDKFKRKRKIADYLLRMGFSSDTVFGSLNRILTLLEP